MLYGRGKDGSCKAYGESLLHSKKTSRTREVTTCQNDWEADKGTYKRRQTHRFCSCIDGPLKAPPLTLFQYMRTRPVVNNCIPTPFLAFQPWPVERHSYLPDPSLGMRVCVRACAYISRRVWAPDYRQRSSISKLEAYSCYNSHVHRPTLSISLIHCARLYTAYTYL